MKAVVMAGGFGTRIQPLTNSRPKPMLPIINRPMMEHTMMKLRDEGITDFIVLLYFKPEIIKDYFEDGSKFGINIEYVVPDNDYGTAGAVKLAQDLIGDENFVIISGDLVTDYDFKEIFKHHKKKRSKLTITLTSVDNPLQFGVVIANEDDRIEKFLEKPSWGEVFSDTINTGIYVIEPEILDHIPKDKNFDFGKDLFPHLMQEGIALTSYNITGYWRDVGNPESYREVYEDILSGKIDIEPDGISYERPDGVLICEEEYFLCESVEVIGKVIIGKNVTIGKDCKLNNVVIGDNVDIGDNCKIRNSVFWNDVKVDRGAELDGCVICNNNKIQKNVKAKSGLILAEGCEIGQLASIEQDVTIWPNKKIDSASIVSNNVVWGDKYKNSIFENGSVIGKSNVELSCEMSIKLAEAFAAQLPVGSTVYVSRDNSKSARMLKRAFLGGILSAGVNVIDVKSMVSTVLRYNIAHDADISGGVHFKQNLDDPTSTEITFFNEEGLRVKSGITKSIEKAFFKGEFRRVEYNKIGEVEESPYQSEVRFYKAGLKDKFNQHMFQCDNCKVVVDVLHGGTTNVFPDIINELNIDNIILNAYKDTKKLSNIDILKKQSEENVSLIVKRLDYDMGFMIYPDGQKLRIIADNGEVLAKDMALLVILYLMNLESRSSKKLRVLLPTWAPDIMDSHFTHLSIRRGKYFTLGADQLAKYDLVATVDGNFAFTEFSLHRDSMYASLKIMEMSARQGIKLSEIVTKIEDFYYKYMQLPCSQELKGKMMRKFLEDAKDKKSSSVDGVKIWHGDNDWILMIPDQYCDNLNFYIQAKDAKSGKKLFKDYEKKIKTWAEK